MQTTPPSPPGKFLVGHLSDFSADSLDFMMKTLDYGDIVFMRFGPFPAYVLNHPDYVHDVMTEEAEQYYKSTVVKNVMAPAVGNGIFTSDGSFWRRQRKLVQPAFHTRRIGAYAEVMTNYAERLVKLWQPGAVLPIDEEMAHLTMRIIAKTLFDAEMEADVNEISESVTTILKRTDERFNQVPTLPYWLPTRANRELRSAIARLDAVIQRFVDERRRTGEDKGDLLSMLLAAQDDDGGGMTDRQVRDEAMTLFGAGHETTAVALTWTFYLLSQHPEIEARLHEEIDRVLAERLPTLADLAHLSYTEMVIKEALRLYPPAWGTSREPIQDVAIGGYPVKKGATVFINIYGMHRDARFFPSPEVFDPERFSPEREKNIPKYAYLPFGMGPRVCIGNAFAMMEARLVLATIAQRVRLRLVPGHEVKPARMFTLRPKFGMKMIVEQRERVTPTAESPAMMHAR